MKTLILLLALMNSFEGIEINGKVFYKPQDKQKTFHNAILNREENGFRDFLYGGAARGGKSYAIRWEAHRNCLQYPRLRGLLVRSSFPELERTHLSQLQFDLPEELLSYNQQKHVARYYNDSILEFGYGTRKEDFQQYLSAEYDFIMIDEMTTIPFNFSYLLRSRLTASRKEFIPFWAGATNPGSIAHVDVRNYFVKKANLDPELFPNYNSKEVFFVPATVFDNKVIIERDPGEVTRLQQLSKKDQQKFLYGNWDLYEGQFFDEFFADVHVVKPAQYLSYDQIREFLVRAGMDYGNTSACEYMYRDYNGNVVVFDEWWDKKGVRSNKVSTLKKFVETRGLQQADIIADTNLWLPDAFDVDNSNYPADDFLRAGLRLLKVSKTTTSPDNHRGYRVACNDAVKDYLHWEEKDGVLVTKPKLLIYQRCSMLLETLPALVTDEKDVEDIADKQDDHFYDAFKMGFMTLYNPRKKEADNRPRWMKELEKKKKLKQKNSFATA